MREAREQRRRWRRDGVPMDERRPLLLEALNRLYEGQSAEGKEQRAGERETGQSE